MNTLDRTLKIQETQSFTNGLPRFDLNRLIPQLTPCKDAVYYLVECRDSSIVSLQGNVEKMFGRKAESIGHLSDLFALIDPGHVDDVIAMKALALEWAVEMSGHLIPLHHRVSLEANFQNQDKIRSLRWDTLIAHIDALGNLTHTVGIFYPLNGKINGGIRVLKGPYSDFIFYPEALEFQPVFGRQEMVILSHIAMGYSNRQIAEKVNLSHRTVETHRKNMIHKLEARNTPHLIYLSTQMGLI